MGEYFQVAIDGPVAAGKGTVAKLLAKKLGWLYIYTGAMYRALALVAKEKGVGWDDGKRLVKLLKKMEMKLEPDEENEPGCRVLVDGRDVTKEIKKMGEGASQVSVFPGVRRLMVKKQQAMAREGNVVMEGRDIAMRVLPEADFKVFLTASVEERAKRRLRELRAVKVKRTLEEMKLEMEKRDERDSTRRADPLQMVKDAWVLDSTDLSIEEVVEKIYDKIKKLRNQRE